MSSLALMRWLENGGPVPLRLVSRLSKCEACWQWASRVARVQNALALLATEAAPVGLLGRANDKALRMLARQLREGTKAERLRRAKPNAPLWTRLEGPLTRQASAVAAAMIILALRAGINEGIDQVHDWAEPLAQTHYERHIDDQGLYTNGPHALELTLVGHVAHTHPVSRGLRLDGPPGGLPDVILYLAGLG